MLFKYNTCLENLKDFVFLKNTHKNIIKQIHNVFFNDYTRLWALLKYEKPTFMISEPPPLNALGSY